MAQTAEVPDSARVFDEIPLEDLGSIAIRVVVLPLKVKKGDQHTIEPVEDVPLDLQPEEMLPESGSSPLGSYLESGKGGKRCCVFLVKGQRQDALDNSFGNF